MNSKHSKENALRFDFLLFPRNTLNQNDAVARR
jgi:hypothetical protein